MTAPDRRCSDLAAIGKLGVELNVATIAAVHNVIPG
jgi:hypothetical protein